MVRVKPWSILGLLSTVILLFGFQAEVIINKPQTIFLIAIPLILQTYGIFMIAYVAARILKLNHNIAAQLVLLGHPIFLNLQLPFQFLYLDYHLELP
ncbi:MAG: hypothetical protein CM1200mP37_7450 [Chloroflexota bacterium]|nr:MAG: hypothetical protein CM1200mP37_7450 [Chloroflexota bacterium]